jgi:thiamine-monophosphate kinase
VCRIAAALGGSSGPPPPGEVWIGDDAAVLSPPRGRLVLSTDAAVAGVHADLSLVGASDLGWKALTATVSDIGAVGARPCYAVVTFCVPPGTDVAGLTAGVAEASARWSCPVVGGDVTGAAQLVVNVAATGELDGSDPPVLRSGASPGDDLVVTGPLGASAAGLRLLQEAARTAVQHRRDPTAEEAALVGAHRRPLARLAEGVVARAAGATAMMDISDGLAIDLNRLADASGVGFALDAVPVAPGATEGEALGGGEDFELLIATRDPWSLAARFAAEGLRAPIRIGRCTADPLERTLAGRPLGRLGFQHRLQ